MKKDDVFEDIEYMQFLQRGKSLLVLKGDEINGKSKLELQTLLGKELGEGVYTVTEKRHGNLKNKTYKIRAIVFGNNTKAVKESDGNDQVLKTISLLAEKIDKIQSEASRSGEAPALQTIMQLTEQNYKMQIEFLKNQLNTLEARYNALEKKYERLKEEAENNTGTDFLSVLSAAQQLKGLKNNANGLHDNPNSDSSGIPQTWINALSKIDFEKVSEKDQNYYVSIFEKFADQLPLKQEA